MATLLGICFITAENQVPQCDVGSTAKTLVIHFDQERFELLFGCSTNLLHVSKDSKVNIARAPLAISCKQVSIETSKILCEPITAHARLK